MKLRHIVLAIVVIFIVIKIGGCSSEEGQLQHKLNTNPGTHDLHVVGGAP